MQTNQRPVTIVIEVQVPAGFHFRRLAKALKDWLRALGLVCSDLRVKGTLEVGDSHPESENAT